MAEKKQNLSWDETWGTVLDERNPWKRPKLVLSLLEKGVDPNLQNKDGDVILAYFCGSEEFYPIIVRLLEAGADPTIKNNDGITVLRPNWKKGMEARGNRYETCQWLFEHAKEIHELAQKKKFSPYRFWAENFRPYIYRLGDEDKCGLTGLLTIPEGETKTVLELYKEMKFNPPAQFVAYSGVSTQKREELMKIYEAGVQKSIKDAEEQLAFERSGKRDWKEMVPFLLSQNRKKEALEILKEHDLVKIKQFQRNGSMTEDKVNNSVHNSGILDSAGYRYGHLETKDSLSGVDLLDLGNGNVAVGFAYDDSNWSGQAVYGVAWGGGVGYSRSVEVGIVNFDKGLIAESERSNPIRWRDPYDSSRDISITNLGNFLKKEGNTIVAQLESHGRKLVSTSVEIPKTETMSSRLKRASNPETAVVKKTTNIIRRKEPPVNG